MGRIYILLLSSFFLFNSNITKAISQQKEAIVPSWVKTKPINRFYYIGVGLAPRTHPKYATIAKQNALKEILSEISVALKVNSVFKQSENDFQGVNESYSSNVNMKTGGEIEGYELVDSYSDKDFYWVYYRLSKDVYEKKKEEKKMQAINKASGFLQSAENAYAKKNIVSALSFYVQSLESLGDYVKQDIQVPAKGYRSFTIPEVVSKAINIFQNIHVDLKDSIYKLDDENKSHVVKGRVYYGNNNQEEESQAIGAIKFLLTDDSKETTIQTHSTKKSGNFDFMINYTPIVQKTQSLYLCLNFDDFTSSSSNLYIKRMFRNVPDNCYKIKIQSKKISAYYQTKLYYNNRIQENTANAFNAVLSYLDNHYFDRTDDKESADLIINIKVSLNKGDKIETGLTTMYVTTGDLSLSIKDRKTNKTFYSDKINQVKKTSLKKPSDVPSSDILQIIQTKFLNNLAKRVGAVNLY